MSFRLGRLFGFTLRIDFSWFIVFFLVLWTFAMGVFPVNLPGRDDPTYLAMGAATTLLFFGSLVLHELSHSLVARAHGIPVDGITLFIFGGIAHTRGEAARPGDEFSIAAAGPLASFALAAILGAVYFAASQAGAEPAITMVIRQAAILNVLVAVFNLLPGFPLDGGRLFRALIWRVTGDLERATRVATVAGAALGYLLVGLGVWRALAGYPISGLWLVFVGWFLRNSAQSSYRDHELVTLLERARAADIMKRDPATIAALADGTTRVSPEWTVQPSDSLTRVLDGLRASPAKRVLVLDRDRLIGIITPGDVTTWLERARLAEKG